MRIQVLSLPDKLVDGEEVARFALILDDYTSPNLVHHEAAQTFRNFAKECGAEDGLVVDRRVEVVEQTATAETVAEIVRTLDELIAARLDQHVAARNISYHITSPTVTNGTFLKAWAEADQRRANGGR